MQELDAWLLDERGHSECIQHWAAKDVRSVFATSPLLLSGNLCLASAGIGGGRVERVLRMPMVDLVRTFEEDRVKQEALEDPEEAFALGPRGLLDALTDSFWPPPSLATPQASLRWLCCIYRAR